MQGAFAEYHNGHPLYLIVRPMLLRSWGILCHSSFPCSHGCSQLHTVAPSETKAGNFKMARASTKTCPASQLPYIVKLGKQASKCRGGRVHHTPQKRCDKIRGNQQCCLPVTVILEDAGCRRRSTLVAHTIVRFTTMDVDKHALNPIHWLPEMLNIVEVESW